MEQPGFFDRLKTRFTQNAAGTTDLSNLTEEQQKLLRRQFIGRLGTSLSQTGDFGAGMDAQANAAAEQRAAMQAETLMQQRRGYFDAPAGLNPNQGALMQPGGVAPPRLLNPASTNPQPGVPAAQAPAQAASPAVQQPQQAIPPREQFIGAIQRAVRGGDMEYAEGLRKQVDTLFPTEKFTAKDMLDANGRRVVGLVGDQGTTRSTSYAPMPVARTQELQDLADPELFARRLAIENAGADRSSTTVLGPDAAAAAMIKIDANRLETLRNEAAQAVAALPSVQSAYEALRGQDTGAFQNALIPLIRYVNPGADLVQAQTIAAAGMTPQLLTQLAGIGGSDTVREVELMLASLPSTANREAVNRKLFEVILAGTQRKIADAQNAESLFYDQGGSLRGFTPQGNIQFDAFQRQFQQDAAARTGLTVEEVVGRHAAPTYRVAFI
ncbi:MAG: hypothetical protein ACK5PF_03320, partial [bacterium]